MSEHSGLKTETEVYATQGFLKLWFADTGDQRRFTRWSAAVSEEKSLQNLYQTLSE
jgi:hypothetical protein